MEIANFQGYIVIREVFTLQHGTRWLVIYGMQVKTFDNLPDAFEEFAQSVRHKMDCDGYND